MQDSSVSSPGLAERRVYIDTGGGAYIGGNVDTGGGDYIGRDKIVLTAEALERLMPQAYLPPGLPPAGELPAPGSRPPGGRLPFSRNLAFTGRQQELIDLAQALFYPPPADRHAAAVVVCGLGGLGKTQLAVELCYRYGRYLHGVHWIAADQDLAAEIAACGAALGLPAPIWPEKLPDQVAFTLQWWAQPGQRRLVVLDNLDDPQVLETWLPQLEAVRLLVTTRRADWPRTLPLHVHRLGTLPRAQSAELLCRLAPRLEKSRPADVDALAERLGDLPLALHLAGSYLDRRPSLTPQGYLQEMARSGGALQHRPLPAALLSSPTHHAADLYTTFLLSWQELDAADAFDRAARFLFCAAACCAPDTPIPLEPLAAALAITQELKQDEMQARVEAGLPLAEMGLERLYGLSLLQAGEQGAMVNRLLAEFGQAWDGIDQTPALPYLAFVLGEMTGQANQSDRPARAVPYLPHLAAVAQQTVALDAETAGWLYNALGSALELRVDFPAARAAYE
jgi:hypothetical protein